MFGTPAIRSPPSGKNSTVSFRVASGTGRTIVSTFPAIDTVTDRRASPITSTSGRVKRMAAVPSGPVVAGPAVSGIVFPSAAAEMVSLAPASGLP